MELTERLTRWLVVALLCVAAPAWGSNVTIPQSTLYNFHNTIELQDEFISGSLSSPGSLGWTVVGGTTTNQISVANHYGLIRRDTSAVSGTTASTRLETGTSSSWDPTIAKSILWNVRINTNDANTTMRMGGMLPAAANPPTQGIYFEKLDADSNWFCVCNTGGVLTRVDSAVGVDLNFHTFRHVRSSSGVQFSIDGVNVCGLITTNIPTQFINAEIQITNSAAASKTLDLDYFQAQLYGFSR